MVTIATRGRAPQRGCETPAAASAAMRDGESVVPAGTTRSPARTSPPSGRTFAPGSTASGTSTASSCSVTSSTGTTASAPSGTTPPVAIPIASPAPSGRGAGFPAATCATIGSVPGVSAARRANPSIAELGKRGRSIAARASSASTRHAASAIATGSPGQRPRAREDLRERVLDGDGIGHGADGTHGVRSGA